MENILSVKNLTVTYEKNIVLKSVSFEVKKGDFVCVVGANGSGKSTLIKTILGLIPPATGKIIYAKNIKKTSIGYLPQESKIDQNFPASVFEIVLSGNLGKLGKKFFYRTEERANAEEALKKLGILKLKNKSFGELSGGQKQKVLLARALVATEDLLILDEPSNNLDHESRKEFYKILKRLNLEGLTIIMITHDLDSSELIGNRITMIEDGKIRSYK